MRFIFYIILPLETALSTLENGQHPAFQRVIFDELLAQRLSMQFARNHRARLLAPKFIKNPQIVEQLLQELPFQLTDAGKKYLKKLLSILCKRNLCFD